MKINILRFTIKSIINKLTSGYITLSSPKLCLVVYFLEK